MLSIPGHIGKFSFQETKVRLADWASTISRLHDSIVVRVRMRSCYCFVFNNRVETAVSQGREVLDRLWAARWDWGNRHHPDGFFQLHSSASPRHRSTAATPRGEKPWRARLARRWFQMQRKQPLSSQPTFVWFSTASLAVPRPARRRVILCD